jgi:AraC-like DNA-binding protein
MDINTSLAFNLLLRGGAILVLLQIAIGLWRDHPRIVTARIGSAFAFGVGAFVVNSVPGFSAHLAWWHAPLIALDSGNMFVFWLFTRALINDNFMLRRWHVAAWGILAMLGVLNCLVIEPLHSWCAGYLGLLLKLASITFAILSVVQSLATWREDLVEGRRHLRMLIIASAAGYSILMMAIALASGRAFLQIISGTENAFGLALLSMLVALQLMGTAGNNLFEPQCNEAHGEGQSERSVEPSKATASDLAVRTATQAAADNPSGPDPKLVRALKRLMEEDRIYREETLTISALAERMRMPEHKLRKLINQGLGYRNFNTFLNAYRIDEASNALIDPAQAGASVLAIAMDAGFQSLGPFNRAFKAIQGVTPTEFRRTTTATA